VILGPRGRKLVLVTHITASAGWIGAVAVSLVLAVTGWTSPDPDLVRASYLTLLPTCRWALIPLSLLSLATGLIQSLLGRWGLLRHYWVVVKLLMNVGASLVLLLYMRTLAALADQARTASSDADLAMPHNPSPVLHGAAAMVLLLVAVVLSVYKPAGLTRYGARRANAAALVRTAG